MKPEGVHLQARVLDAVHDPILVVDVEGEIRMANAAAVRFFGLTRGSSLSTILGRIRVDEALMSEPVARRSRVRDVVVTDGEGRDSGIHIDIEPLDVPGDDALSVLHVHAPTEALEHELWTDDAVAAAAHELKNPLAAMRNVIELLASREPGPLSEAQERFVAALDRSARRLTRLTDGYLDLARLRAGSFTVERALADVDEVVGRIVADFVALHPRAAGRVHVDVDAGAGTAWMDPDRIEQALVNVLANALRFSRGEPVVVRATRSGREVLEDEQRQLPWEHLGEPEFVTIEVEDRGLGMSSATLAHVFDASHHSGDGAGTHLGMHITRGLVDAHAGCIFVESHLGEGTTVRLTIPADARTATMVERLRAAERTLAAMHAARRGALVVVLGQTRREDWLDIANAWRARPVVNAPHAAPLSANALWSIGDGLAISVIAGTRGQDIARAIASPQRRVDDGAWSMPGYALGSSRANDREALAPVLTRAMQRMRVALTALANEPGDAGPREPAWLAAGILGQVNSHEE